MNEPNPQSVSFEKIDEALIKVLKRYISDEGYSPFAGLIHEYDRSSIQIATLENKTALECFGTPQQKENPTLHDSSLNFNMDGKIHIRKIIWNLIFQGKLVPGTDTENGWPWLTITPEGEAWLLSEADDAMKVATTATQYMERLNDNGVILGDITKGYLIEAVNCYYNQSPRASIVMAGTAVEALFDEVNEAMDGATDEPWASITLAARKRNYSDRLTSFYNKVVQPYHLEIAEVTGVENPRLLVFDAFECIRQRRNDSAHAALPNHDYNEAFALLELCARIIEIMAKFRDHIKPS